MKPRSQNGVVDPRLNVYGTKGLKVAGKFLPSLLLNHRTWSVFILRILDVVSDTEPDI